MRFLILAASHRADSANRRLAKLAAAHMESLEHGVDFAEYTELDAPLYNDELATTHGVPAAAQAFAKRAANADGVIISSPEYNWSYPGSLKTIIDWTSRLQPNPVAGKTALLMSATPGMRGGVLGLSHLRAPLEALQMVVFPRFFLLGNAHNAHDAEGGLSNEKLRRQFTDLLNDYAVFTRKLAEPQ